VKDDDLHRLRRQIKLLYQRLQKEFPPGEGLPRSVLQVLLAVDRHGGPVGPGQISEELGMANSNVATALRALEASSLVALVDDPDDGRRALIHLTRIGRKRTTEFREKYYAWFRDVIEARLSADEQVLLLRAGELMQRLAEATPDQIASPERAGRKRLAASPADPLEV
jgi:DNA-binding MarR family transcriptional regulator